MRFESRPHFDGVNNEHVVADSAAAEHLKTIFAALPPIPERTNGDGAVTGREVRAARNVQAYNNPCAAQNHSRGTAHRTLTIIRSRVTLAMIEAAAIQKLCDRRRLFVSAAISVPE